MGAAHKYNLRSAASPSPWGGPPPAEVERHSNRTPLRTPRSQRHKKLPKKREIKTTTPTTALNDDDEHQPKPVRRLLDIPLFSSPIVNEIETTSVSSTNANQPEEKEARSQLPFKQLFLLIILILFIIVIVFCDVHSWTKVWLDVFSSGPILAGLITFVLSSIVLYFDSHVPGLNPPMLIPGWSMSPVPDPSYLMAYVMSIFVSLYVYLFPKF